MAKAAKLGHAALDRVIGRRIRRRRTILKMSQAMLANALGVSFQHVQRYENGAAHLNPERLKEIAHFLGVEPEHLRHAPATPTHQANITESFAASADGLRLLEAVARIEDASTRDRLITAIEAVSESKSGDGDTAQPKLEAWLRTSSRKDGARENAREAANAIQAIKADIARLLGRTIKSRKMSQAYTAQILDTDQGRISTVARGLIRAISLEMLLRYILLLGWDITIDIKKRPIEDRASIGADTVSVSDFPQITGSEIERRL